MSKIDLSNGSEETSTWYVMTYDNAFGETLTDVQECKPDWTNDYHVVTTSAWYPGSEGDWKQSIGRQVLAKLGQA